MAEVQGVPSGAGGRNPLTPEQIARKKELGIPIHLTEKECTFVDGYCTCGARHAKMRSGEGPRWRGKRTLGKPSIDSTEKNFGEYH